MPYEVGIQAPCCSPMRFGTRRPGTDATAFGAVPYAARSVAADWVALAGAISESPPPFTVELVNWLPEPVRRMLIHAVDPGTPMWRSARLRMEGEIRLGSWRYFAAEQVITPEAGFIWSATTKVLGLPVSGFDKFSNGTGEMRWRFFGVIPLVTALGEDITRSAAGRLAAESVFVPTMLVRAAWVSTAADTAIATWRIGGQDEQVQLSVDTAGALREVTMLRWGNPAGRPFGRYPFHVVVEAERHFVSMTIPSRVRAFWPPLEESDDDGEFFRATITDANFI